LGGRPFVALFPGASIPERRWGTDNFSRVTAALTRRGVAVAVVGGAEDASAAAEIAVAGDGLNLAGRTTLAETAAVLERAAVLLGGDSGVLHVAAGLGRPTVSLFGPGIAAKWAPRGEAHIVLDRRLSCSPCTRFGCTPACPEGVRCLVEISPTEAVEAVIRLLPSSAEGNPH